MSDKSIDVCDACGQIGEHSSLCIIEELREVWETFKREPTTAHADALTALFAPALSRERKP